MQGNHRARSFVQKTKFKRTSVITKRGRIITKRGDLITEIIFTPLCGYNYTCSELVLVIGMLGVQLHINHESLPKKRKICPSAKHEDQI